jgi:hypothetical protein
LIEESGLRRNVDRVFRRLIKGVRSAGANIGQRRSRKRLGLRYDLASRQGGRGAKAVVRQVLALRDVKDDIAPQERHRLALAVPVALA